MSKLEKQYDTRGTHIILDIWGVNPNLLNNIHYLHTIGKFAIAKAGATFVDMVMKQFSPEGCTLLFLLEESHLSMHSYVSDGFMALDMYCCGDADPNIAVDYFIKELKPDPNRIYRKEIIRGVE